MTDPFGEADFLPLARQFRAALTLPLILLGGITARASIDQAMTEGFDFVAIGRALLREPDLVREFASGESAAVRAYIGTSASRASTRARAASLIIPIR
jgi:2,4-dienoyl-CoA reductase-like NADH-dependent reductase (Old Yellow Enzyme family)